MWSEVAPGQFELSVDQPTDFLQVYGLDAGKLSQATPDASATTGTSAAGGQHFTMVHSTVGAAWSAGTILLKYTM